MNSFKRVVSLLPLTCLLLFFAAPRTRAEEFPRGVVIEKVTCKADAGQSYALYLPPAYTPEKKWPVIYAFDPGGRGRIPLERYKEAAETYGYIVAGSYNSQNGMQSLPLQTAILSLIKDTRERLSIDEKRVYTTGFSGGARVATRVASSCSGCIAGVIACGASFPSDIVPSQTTAFVFYGTVGIDDFNYPELKQLDEKLNALNLPHHIATFAGGHEWASSALLLEAVEWMELQALRAGRRERDGALIEALWKKGAERARALEAAHKSYEAYLEYGALAAGFKGLKDVSEYEKKMAALKETKEVRQSLNDEQEQLPKQLALAKKMIELGSRLLAEPSARGDTLKEMRALIEGLRIKAKAAEDSGERRVARRALRQVFAQTIEAAMYNYLPRGQYELALINLEVAQEVAPDNWEVPYEMARAYSLSGDKKKALDALKRAADKGFPSAAAIEEEKDFTALRSEAEFKTIINQIKSR